MQISDSHRRLDRIRIHQLKLSCIVGIWPRERQVEQPIVIDVTLGVDLRRAGQSGRISHTVNYAQVEECVSTMLRFRRYQLIESAAEELCAMLFGTQPQLQEVRLRIEKPAALAGRARAASVEIHRCRDDFPMTQVAVLQSGRSLATERLWSTEEAELSLIHLPHAALWQPCIGADQRGIHWLVTGRLRAAESILEAGVIDPIACESSLPWTNHDPTEAVMFSCLATPGGDQ